MNCLNNWSNIGGRCFLLLLVTTLFFAGCKNKQEVTERRGILNFRNTETLVSKMQENEFKTEWLSLKLAVAFESEDASDSFKMYVRMKKDSVMWISATYYAVEVARFLVTPDSIKFMDRKDDKYYAGGIGFIKDSFNLDFNFESLQALLLGNSIGIDDSTKIRSYSKKDYYQLSSLKKGLFRRAEGRMEKGEDVSYSNWLDPVTFKIARISIFDVRTSRTMEASYSQFEELIGQLFPRKIDMKIMNAGKTTTVDIEYLKANSEGPYKLSFRIPEKYERITP